MTHTSTYVYIDIQVHTSPSFLLPLIMCLYARVSVCDGSAALSNKRKGERKGGRREGRIKERRRKDRKKKRGVYYDLI